MPISSGSLPQTAEDTTRASRMTPRSSARAGKPKLLCGGPSDNGAE
jgi:hypothetical protein